MKPNYSEERFQPTDKFHSTCLESAEFYLQTNNQELQEINIKINYDPGILQIVNTEKIDSEQNSEHKLEYDTIYFNSKNLLSGLEIPLLKVFFKSLGGTINSKLSISSGSYIITKNNQKINLNQGFELNFQEVEECEPDIIAPSIELISPKNLSTGVAIDSDIIFLVRDLGKGVDKNKLFIEIDGNSYSGGQIIRSGDYAKVLPDFRLEIGRKIILNIEAKDLQQYGGPNTLKKQFQFEVATGLIFQNNISIQEFRKLSQEKINGTESECKTISMLYEKSSGYYRLVLAKLLKKISCELPKNSGLLTAKDNLLIKNTQTIKQPSTPNIKTENQKKFSIFALLGRTMFFIALSLKVYYMAGYHKYKKISKKNNKN